MAYPKKPTPEKYCLQCGARLERKRINGRLEDLTVFNRRKYCNLSCSSKAHQKELPTKSAYHKRAQAFRKTHCEHCGTSENLQVHHQDLNPANNNPSNLVTLCGTCHLKWHWANGKKPLPKKASVCEICGAQPKKLHRGMCGKHYQRFKKYGDPYLTKTRSGSHYGLVKATE